MAILVIMTTWPLRDLVIRTPRLEMRPDDDAGLGELVSVALDGVHPPDRQPFIAEWTDAPREQIGINTLRHFWGQRATCEPGDWKVNLLVRLDGRVIGTQGVYGRDFGLLREVSSGSWLGRRHQGLGYGTEMRAGVLAFAFDHLGARTARSGSFADNAASLAVSRGLGYRPDGTVTARRRGQVATEVRLLVTRDDFQNHRPEWKPQVEGLSDALWMFGVTDA